MPCHVITCLSITRIILSQNIYLLHNIFCHMVLSVAIMSHYVCHLLHVMPCYKIFTVTCYTMLQNIVYYMLCHVIKYYLLHVCHVMKCCLLHLCLKVCHISHLTFISTVLQDFCLFVFMSSCLDSLVKLFMSITTLSARMG